MFTEDHGGKPPANLDDLAKVSGTNPEPYVSPEVPPDAWGRRLRYTVKPSGKVELRSSGADGQFDTEDDLVNELDLGESSGRR